MTQKREMKMNGGKARVGVIWDHTDPCMGLRRGRAWKYDFFSKTSWHSRSGAGWRCIPHPDNVAVSGPQFQQFACEDVRIIGQPQFSLG